MKSSHCSDEICFADEIKSVLSSDEVGFHHKVISSQIVGFHPSVRTDLVEKKPSFVYQTKNGFFSMARCKGLTVCIRTRRLEHSSAPFAPKNSPPDCFLNVATLSGSSPQRVGYKEKTDNRSYLLSYGALQGTYRVHTHTKA